ncbi:M16 family metallopeptidase [Rufibacter latericius]|uniref:Insulinase family protein n=1 Tax=Rufibacter latericius TaxID=2487040 RepID=A0A3M9MLF0_9BACT|nr:pitrilysin family protein [Rufibacter latericius]RNI26309.1 insulinase family protein [Rufibacter latericius]
MLLNRTIAPAIAELSSDLSITPEVKITPSGARLHIFENNIQPVVRVEFVFKAGKWFQTKPGVASLTAKMLKEGTRLNSAKELADAIDFHGASLEVNHGFDRATVTLYCLSKFLPSLLPLAFEIIQQPSFPETEFALMKQRVIQTLAVDKQKNSYLATESFTIAVYGKDHPYVSSISEEEIAALQVKDLISFHNEAYSFSSAEVFITGDIDQSGINTILAGLSGDGTSAAPSPTISNTIPQVGLLPVTTQNQMQASIRVGKPIIRPIHLDYPALYLLNHILGGYFGSRLMKNIREDKGFTYGIYSSLSHKERDSLFFIGADIKGDKIRETLEEISKEIHLLKVEEVHEEEFATAKKHLAGKFLSDHATIFDKMDKYKSNVLLGLPPDFYSQLLASVQELSPEEVTRAANKHLPEDTLLKVVTGGKME